VYSFVSMYSFRRLACTITDVSTHLSKFQCGPILYRKVFCV
jgi:hypothetical protein